MSNSNTKKIKLGGKRGVGKFALVDAEDYPLVTQHNWYVNETGYAISRINGRLTRMHRLIMSADKGQNIDHENGDPLDNRRSNLRWANQFQNMRNARPKSTNKTGYKGVYYHWQRSKFRAQITHNHKQIHIGYYETPEEAARAYDEAARKYHKEFAWLNEENGRFD